MKPRRKGTIQEFQNGRYFMYVTTWEETSIDGKEAKEENNAGDKEKEEFTEDELTNIKDRAMSLAYRHPNKYWAYAYEDFAFRADYLQALIMRSRNEDKTRGTGACGSGSKQ